MITSGINLSQYFEKFKKNTGFWLLVLTVLLLSGPRFLPFWSLAFFLLSGFLFWIRNFNDLISPFKKDFYKISGLLLYSFLHIVWALIQQPLPEKFLSSLLFLAIPVLGYPIFISACLRDNISLVFRAFILGIVAVSILDILIAIAGSVDFYDGHLVFDPGIDYEISSMSSDYLSSKSRFLSQTLSFFENPYYLSVKIVFALILIFEVRNKLKFNKIYGIVLVIALSVFLFMLSSRFSVIAAVFVIIFYLTKELIKRARKILIYLTIPVLFIAFILILFSNTRIKEKTTVLIEKMKDGGVGIFKAEPRLLAWDTSLDLIKKYPLFGMGLAARDSLAKSYERRGYLYEATIKLNPHNQFIENQLAFGIPGLISLFLLLIFPLMRKTGYISSGLYSGFFILITGASMFASFLVSIWGSVFFILFYCIFTLGKNPEGDSSYF